MERLLWDRIQEIYHLALPVARLHLSANLSRRRPKAFKYQDGGLTGENLDKVKKFLTTTAAQVNVKTSSDNQKITLTGQGNMLVKLIEFKHE